MTKDEKSHGVNVGNLTGGIHSIIAGRDLWNATIMLSGQPTQADKEPSVEELKQLLTEIQSDLPEVLSQRKTLEAILPAVPFTSQGPEKSVNGAIEQVMPDEMKPELAKSVHRRVSEGISL